MPTPSDKELAQVDPLWLDKELFFIFSTAFVAEVLDDNNAPEDTEVFMAFRSWRHPIVGFIVVGKN